MREELNYLEQRREQEADGEAACPNQPNLHM